MPVTPLSSPTTSSRVWLQLELDLAFGDLGHQAVDQDRLGAELVAAVDQGDLAGDVGQVQRFLDRGIAAADHRHFLVAVEEAVAGGAGRHALAHEGFFRRQAQVLGRGAGGDDQRVAGVFAGVADQADRLFVQVGRVDVVEHDFGLEALGVLQQALHQFRTLHAHRVARPVLDIGGGHQLAALLDAGDQHRFQVGAGRVDGGAVAGGAGTEDQDFGVFGSGHKISSAIKGGGWGRAAEKTTTGDTGCEPARKHVCTAYGAAPPDFNPGSGISQVAP